jgi:hypothetical protein
MSECPTCGRALRDSVCPYCDEELSESGDVESTPVTGESMVVVFSSDLERHSDHVMALLESEGIPVFVDSATGDDIIHEGGDALGDFVIRVAEEDADRAREVIEAVEQELSADDD